MQTNPVRTISDSCATMRQLSQELQSARGETTDVSDVFDISSSILTTIIKESAGSDPNENVFEDSKKFDVMSRQKESEFLKKMNKVISDVGNELTKATKRLENVQQKMQFITENNKLIMQKSLKKFDYESAKKLDEYKMKLFEEEEEMAKQEKLAFSNFEEFLSQQMAIVSKQYKQKMAEFDNTITSLQLQLQNAVHNKHQQKTSKNESLEQEDRRMAAEHERLSREHQEKKENYERRILQLKDEIIETKQEINLNLDSNESKFESNERDYIEKHRKEVEIMKLKIMSLENDVKEHRMQKEQLSIELARSKTDSDSEMSEILGKYSEKMKQIKKETIEMKNKIKEEISDQYIPQVESLQDRISVLEEDRKRQMQMMREQQLKESEETDTDIRGLREEQKVELDGLYQILNDCKKKLRDLKNERDKNLEDVKHEKQKVLGEAMTKDDDLTKNRAAQINDLMRQFDEAQRKQLDGHYITLDQKNAKKDALIKKLQEKELNLGDDVSKELCSEVGSLNSRIDNVNGRIGLLNMKLKSMEKSTLRALEQYADVDDETLEEDLKKAAESGSEEANVVDLANRLSTASSKIENRKNMVLKEADDVTKSINNAHESFEKKLTQMEHQFKASKQHLQNQSKQLDMRQKSIDKIVLDQRIKLASLDNTVTQKKNEVDIFEKTFDAQKEKFEMETKDKYESNLAEISKQPIDLEKEMNQIRDSLTTEIEILKEDLENAKRKTMKITEFHLRQRDDKQDEERALMEDFHNENISKMMKNHELQMKRMSDELKNARKHRNQNIETIENDFQKQRKENQRQFSDLMNDLSHEKENLFSESEKLEKEHEYMKTRECPDCRKKKDQIKLMLDKKKSIEFRMEEHQESLQQTEQNMNAIFGKKQKKANVATPLLEIPKAQGHGSPYIAKPRSKTAIGTKPATTANSKPQTAMSSKPPTSNITPR